jgi:hypothetical protein
MDWTVFMQTTRTGALLCAMQFGESLTESQTNRRKKLDLMIENFPKKCRRSDQVFSWAGEEFGFARVLHRCDVHDGTMLS